MKKSLTAVMLLVLSVSLLFGCTSTDSSEDTWKDLEDRGTVIVGFDDTFVPMGFKDGSGEIIGFDIDLAKEAIGRMGLEPEFQPIDWNLKETELNTKNIDLIWNGYTITDERKEKVNFTKPYLDNRQVIVVLSGSDIDMKADLEGRIVAAQNASSALAAIQAEGAAETFDGGEPILFDTYNDAFMDLEAGRVHAVVADEILARYYISERGEEKYKVLDEDFGDEEYGVGVRKSDEILLGKLNDILDEMKSDGSAEAISEKWFGENIVK
ncbi:amino acid ABC transporter substrate-binding protein [Alkalibacter saccharofermentans]|uniref:Polar amino acid transport system substrate-binding protein n=1 Tax=Alkalibacter saccharofermentans DSM 14828 TaxID=1120975 RepID=A0A1M4WM50_9FIRM|nr:amino acid ABC transporter substrate-binding protein [Alkalibacter saccharofermentans]SHE82284.1 polar amino acid transport system substrate-binding protein [Alkalibacter saccharofermentans DSM 14828]